MRRRNSGQAIVEFSLVFPVLFFLLVGSIDLFRIVEVNTTVAEAPCRMKGPITTRYIASATKPPVRAAAIAASRALPVRWWTR